MILGEAFERFAAESPVSVMAQAVLENALPPSTVDSLFEDLAERQYTRTLLFSDVVNLMATVVCKIRPSINAAFKKNAEALGVTRKAVYEKINRVETGLSAALVRQSSDAVGPVISAMGGRSQPWLDGYRVRIVDGSHLPGTEHRIKPLRATRAGALPGQAIVLFEPETGLVSDVVLSEDGHAQERSMTGPLLAKLAANDLWIADRNFCTTRLLFGIAAPGGSFVIRQHATTLCWEAVGEPQSRPRCETGAVSEQAIRLTDECGEALLARRITIELDEATGDGDRTMHILTNLPADRADASAVAALYRRRWTVETAFQELEAALHGEIDALGYPKAALFAFCVALVSYDVLSTIKAAVRSVHGPEVADEQLSGSDLAEEIAGTHRGLRIAIPEDEWAIFHDLSAGTMGQLLTELTRAIRLSQYRKQPRGPKKPRPARQSGAEIKHVATSKLLKGKKQCAP